MQRMTPMALQIQDLPLESCVAVGCNTSVARAAEMATKDGARYVMVHEATGDVRGVQLTSVASGADEGSGSRGVPRSTGAWTLPHDDATARNTSENFDLMRAF